MHKLTLLIRKSMATLIREGPDAFWRKAMVFTRTMEAARQLAQVNEQEKRAFRDVLFISGCSLPHPHRYRVSHQREQLLANNVTSQEIYAEGLTLDLIKYYRVFIFFRCPFNEQIGVFIEMAKKSHKTVLFDIDDLVIDTSYTDQIPYVQSMSATNRAQYDADVDRMGQLLQMCDGAITSTEHLAEELRRYVPDVFLNRNTASERMVHLSDAAVTLRDVLSASDGPVTGDRQTRRHIDRARRERTVRQGRVRLGYFSGSLSHRDDFALILPVLVRMLRRHKNVYLYIVGELELPAELKPFAAQVVHKEFLPWEQLPELIASVDINLAPLTDSIFNRAKSENKWIEAALVKVPTVASRLGAMEQCVVDGETGVLCTSQEDWEHALEYLIIDGGYRLRLGEVAYQWVRSHNTTIVTGYPLAAYIRGKMQPNIAFVVPSLATSGGVLVALRHALFLRDSGRDVLIISDGLEQTDVALPDGELFAVSRKNTGLFGSFDACVATLWSTVAFVESYPRIRQRFYLVQGFETDFLPFGDPLRMRANQTYTSPADLRYVTISRWCQQWLKDNYGKIACFAPNGLDSKAFYPIQREFSGRIRILIEGNSANPIKNVDESFRIVEGLDPAKYEIWYMCYEGVPKSWYRVDRFLQNVAYGDVPDVYRQCHILLKTSLLESFSYPPLEMMSTGGQVVVLPNCGNIEYLRDGENCLMFPHGEIEVGIQAIERICYDEELRQRMTENGYRTASERDWANIQQRIVSLYTRLPECTK